MICQHTLYLVKYSTVGVYFANVMPKASREAQVIYYMLSVNCTSPVVCLWFSEAFNQPLDEAFPLLETAFHCHDF